MGWTLLQDPRTRISQPLDDEAVKDAYPESKKLQEDVASISSSSISQPFRITRPEGLKQQLKSLLSRNGGCTKDPAVLAIIEELTKFNPCSGNCYDSPEFLGDFINLSCPNFPGRLSAESGHEDVIRYTLGRISFNIFQPAKLVCTMKGVRNTITKQGYTEDGQPKFSYPLICDIIIHTLGGDLPAMLINEACCYGNSDVNNRLCVSFQGGTLVPAQATLNDPEKLRLWSQTFEGAYKKADEERSYFGWVFQFFLKILLGLTYPTDESLAMHSFRFEMRRSPVGFIDVLYLDQDLRITKGNRGTIVVVERLNRDVDLGQ